MGKRSAIDAAEAERSQSRMKTAQAQLSIAGTGACTLLESLKHLKSVLSTYYNKSRNLKAARNGIGLKGHGGKMNSESVIIKAMAQKNGLQVVKAKLVEECAELIRALARGEDRNIIEELVDVQIMLWQMLELLPESKTELLEEVVQEKYQHLEFVLDLLTTEEDDDDAMTARLIDEVSG